MKLSILIMISGKHSHIIDIKLITILIFSSIKNIYLFKNTFSIVKNLFSFVKNLFSLVKKVFSFVKNYFGL